MPSSVRISGVLLGLAGIAVADGRHRAQQRRDRDLALAVDLDREDVTVARLELQPGAPVRDQLGGEERATRGRIVFGGVIDARRAHELADHHALGAVDDECALSRHEREIAHEDVLSPGSRQSPYRSVAP